MMKNLILILPIVFLSFLNLKVQKDGLVGKWNCFHKEFQDGTSKSTDLFSGEEFELNCTGLVIELKSDGTGWESLGEQNFRYKIRDSILTLGNRSFIVELVNENQLVLRDYSPNGLLTSDFRQKFKRIE